MLHSLLCVNNILRVCVCLWVCTPHSWSIYLLRNTGWVYILTPGAKVCVGYLWNTLVSFSLDIHLVPSPAFSFCLLLFQPSGRSEAISHCGFHLHLPDGYWPCPPFHIPTSHCMYFLKNVYLDHLAIFKHVISEQFLPLNSLSFLKIHKSLLETVCVFCLSEGCLFTVGYFLCCTIQS